jgi:hypothetical protein
MKTKKWKLQLLKHFGLNNRGVGLQKMVGNKVCTQSARRDKRLFTQIAHVIPGPWCSGLFLGLRLGSDQVGDILQSARCGGCDPLRFGGR